MSGRKLYLDENVDEQLAARLQAGGFDVLTTRAAGMQGATDEEQLRFASDQGRVLFTHNIRDFMALSRRWANENRTHAGIVYSSFHQPSTLYEWISELFDLYDDLTDMTIFVPISRDR